MKKKVIDLSMWNTVKDWGKLAKEVDGIILRVGYRGYGSSGTLKVDNNFKSFAKNCAKYSIPFGCYFFTQATTVAEAKEEANYVHDLVKEYSPVLPIYCDSELAKDGDGRADKLTRTVRTKCVKAFCEQLKSFGYTTGVYASESWFNNQLDSANLPYTYWCAGYSTQKPSLKKNNSKVDAWQYTDKYTTAACSAQVDCSYFYKDFTVRQVKSEIGLYFRSGASKSKTAICVIPNKDRLSLVVGNCGKADGFDWAKAIYNGKTGYIANKYLSLV